MPESPPDPQAAAELAAATRRVIDRVRRSAAPAEAMRAAARALDAVARELEPHDHPGPYMQRGLEWEGTLRPDERPEDFRVFFPYSPIVGPRNPLSPPVRFEIRDGRIRGRAVFPAAYVGPPQSVHGGIIAATLDELLGSTNLVHGVGGMTGTLTVRYRAPTPIEREIELEGWLDRVEGRKVYTRGEMRLEGQVLAEAEGIFILGAVHRLRAALGG